MRVLLQRLLCFAGVLCACAQTEPIPDAEQQKAILARVAKMAQQYHGHLPDFMCTQTSIRSRARSSAQDAWKQYDTIEEEVSFYGGRPHFKLLKINGKPTNLARSKIGGVEFDDMLGDGIDPDWIFGSQAGPRFDWDRSGLRGGERLDLFAFQAPHSRSLRPFNKAFIVGYHGSFSANAETGILTKLEYFIVPPVGYPFEDSRLEVEYGPVSLSGKMISLPVRGTAEVRKGKDLYRNVVQFSNYRKYTADSAITFGEPKGEQGP